MEIKAYTSPGCFYCDQLKELFKRAKLDADVILINKDNKEQFRKEHPQVGSFPYVIIDGEIVGGLVETAKFLVKRGLVSAKKE
jgi:glutaredoxin|tara:strand:- start:49 stop:297 length:249 start_codon:yes stop_codon:yes gene_type:complete